MARSCWRTVLRTVTPRAARLRAAAGLAVLVAACGGEAAFNPSPDGASPIDGRATECNALTCPTGCCDTEGQCESGDGLDECGSSGRACQDCQASGYATCDAALHTCATPLTSCGPATCRGCCVQNTCYAGIDPANCGSAGQACVSCTAIGLACAGQRCVSCTGDACTGVGTGCLEGGAGCPAAANCGPSTCPAGCCDATGVCRPGTADMSCGGHGGACQTCRSGDECIDQTCAAKPCSETCAGCCNPSDTCRPGDSTTACGVYGAACVDCSVEGDECSDQQCSVPADAGTCICPLGCCDAFNECHPGASNTQCGAGSACEDCTSSGTECVGQQCIDAAGAAVCNEQTCASGCCDGNGACQQGITGSVCGGFGTTCQNCLSSGALCTGQTCTNPGTATGCNPETCGGCCDALGRCIQGPVDRACGASGNRCVDCIELGSRCVDGECIAPDGGTICSQSCAGCCDSNGDCASGFADTQCGESGGDCEDCTALASPSTCDENVSPRTCASQQMLCPQPYPGCPAGLQQPAPARQHVCDPSDLQAFGAACSAGAHTSECDLFLNGESSVDPDCYNCFQPFVFDFSEQAGIRSCVVPFLDTTCNGNNSCIVDCLAQSCYECGDGPSAAQCDAQVQAGACSAYFQGDACVTQALAGAGAVCNPSTYQQNLGAWLQAVGEKYCAL